MLPIHLLSRPMTDAEFQQMKIGFDTHTLEQGVAIQQSTRFTHVAQQAERFIGCASCLAYQNGENYSGWAYLTDLFVEKAFRGQGLGSQLLRALEQRLMEVGTTRIWTWTAGYEAPGFYRKLGYEVFAEMENWYSDGSSRVGLRKTLR